jgi:hypothetical protein
MVLGLILACAESTGSGLADPANADAGGADAGGADAGEFPPDAGGTPEDAGPQFSDVGPPPEDCELSDPLVVPAEFLFDGRPLFVLSAGDLYVRRRLEVPMVGVWQERHRIDDRSSEIRFDESSVVAAEGEALLWAEEHRDGSVTLRHQVGDRSTDYRLSAFSLPWLVDFTQGTSGHRLLDERGVLMPHQGAGRVLWLTQGRSEVIGSLGGGTGLLPWLGAEGAAWVVQGWDAESRLVRYDFGWGMTSQLRRSGVQGVVMVGDELVWLEGGALWAGDPDSVVGPTRWHEGPCLRLVSDGDAALAVCGEGWFGDTLIRYAGEVQEVHRVEGGAIVSPVLDGDWLAWAEYADRTQLEVPPAGESVGRAVFLHRPSGTRLEAPMGAGCYTCALVWPLPEVRLSGGYAAWNYADGEAFPLDRVAVAGLRLPGCGTARD